MKRRIARVEQHIERYLSLLDEADRAAPAVRDTKVPDLAEKIASLKAEMRRLKKREREVLAHPDSRLMKKGGMGSQVGYNVQTAVDTKHKLIVAHAKLAQCALQQDEITVLADRGYYKGEAIHACYRAGIKVLVPKSFTSGNKAAGLFDKQDFRYDALTDQYRCPAGEVLPRRHSSVEKGMTIHSYYASALVCRDCKLKTQCTKGKERRVRRWEHEELLDVMAEELRNTPEAMPMRAQTSEHPFGTIKLWTGSSHFLMKRLTNVRTEMSLHVLAYNLRRMISILGVRPLIEAVRA
jgi:hypothetical protein